MFALTQRGVFVMPFRLFPLEAYLLPVECQGLKPICIRMKCILCTTSLHVREKEGEGESVGAAHRYIVKILQCPLHVYMHAYFRVARVYDKYNIWLLLSIKFDEDPPIVP